MRGLEPPVSTTWPPIRAVAASRKATSAAGSSATTISISLAIAAELARSRHCRLDRVQERGAHAGLFELADRGDRCPARGGDRFAQLDRMDLLVTQLLGGAEHRLHD